MCEQAGYSLYFRPYMELLIELLYSLENLSTTRIVIVVYRERLVYDVEIEEMFLTIVAHAPTGDR